MIPTVTINGCFISTSEHGLRSSRTCALVNKHNHHSPDAPDGKLLICSEKLLLSHEKFQDSWPPEEKNSIWGQRQGLIFQGFCVTKFY